MKHERGDTDFLKPVTESEHNIYYGNHAVSEIVKHLREGIVPRQESGFGTDFFKTNNEIIAPKA